MQKFPLHIIILLCQLSFVTKAQYLGGNAEGFAYSPLIASVCPPVVGTNIYFGGSSDGFAYNPLIASVCPPVVGTNIYFGGNSDGFAYNPLIASVCPPVVGTNIYFGGNSDGFAYNPLIASVCPPVVGTNIYFGGNSDGFANRPLIASVCPPGVGTNIYFGGNSDGFAYNPLIASICPPNVGTNIYFGGSSDGFSFYVLNQTPCASLTVLPIELLNFTAEKNKSIVDIKWSTTSELNNNYFTVEKAKDGINFEFVAKVTGAGNSNTLKKYVTQDEKPYQGVSYYRLKQTDFDGKFKYSKIAVVDFLNADDGLKIYPNPTNDIVTIDFLEQLSPQSTLVSLTNVYGQQLSLNQIISKNQVKMDLSKLPSGIYFIGITLGEKTIERKIVLQK
jgi:hypothetical protein